MKVLRATVRPMTLSRALSTRLVVPEPIGSSAWYRPFCDVIIRLNAEDARRGRAGHCHSFEAREREWPSCGVREDRVPRQARRLLGNGPTDPWQGSEQ